jgi:hypothetical protein
VILNWNVSLRTILKLSRGFLKIVIFFLPPSLSSHHGKGGEGASRAVGGETSPPRGPTWVKKRGRGAPPPGEEGEEWRERGCAGETKMDNSLGNNVGRAHRRRNPHWNRGEKHRLGMNRRSDRRIKGTERSSQWDKRNGTLRFHRWHTNWN